MDFIRSCVREKSFNILQEELVLYFACPVTGRIAPTNHGSGYSVKVPTALGKQVAPVLGFAEGLLRLSLFVLGASIGIGGPVSCVLSCVPFIGNSCKISHGLADYQRNMQQYAQIASINGACLQVLHSQSSDECDVSQLQSVCEGLQDIPVDGLVMSQVPVVTGAEYALLVELLSHIHTTQGNVLITAGGYLRIKESGMLKCTASDGSIAWVHETQIEEFQLRGRSSLRPEVQAKLPTHT